MPLDNHMLGYSDSDIRLTSLGAKAEIKGHRIGGLSAECLGERIEETGDESLFDSLALGGETLSV